MIRHEHERHERPNDKQLRLFAPVGRREFFKRASLLAGSISWSLAAVGEFSKLGAAPLASPTTQARRLPRPLAWADQQPGGELLTRLRRNFARLESNIYDADHVFKTTDGGDPWPGDTEGRLVLGVTLEAQALQQKPKYLEEILRRFPGKFNARGLFGTERPADVFDEQLLSSHGWVLRGLSEYYLWTQDRRMPGWINRMLDSLAKPLRGKILASYPLDPDLRKHSTAESGFVNQKLNDWQVSSDTGCIFIFFDGLVQAAFLQGREDLYPVIEELQTLFLRADLMAMQAQTHAVLTGLRALCRIYEHQPSASLLRAIQDRWSLYCHSAMTANSENYNWFGRPDWTEACAVLDSLLVAVSLWQFTGDPAYLEAAHLIYYNGVAAEQRSNGGFGLNSCARPEKPILRVHEYEATWCCTMRGGEGLARAAQFALFAEENAVVVAFPRDGEAVIRLGDDFIKLRQTTGYPHTGWSRLEVLEISPKFSGHIKLFSPRWASAPRVKLNDRELKVRTTAGFLVVAEPLQPGDCLHWTFDQPLRTVRDQAGNMAFYRGPLLFGSKNDASPIALSPQATPSTADPSAITLDGMTLAPVYHLMELEAERRDYGRQVLFARAEPKSSDDPTRSHI